MTLTRRHL